MNDSTDVDNAVLSENKLTRRSIDNHIKLKEEEDDIKLPKSECPVFGEEATAYLKSDTVLKFKLGCVYWIYAVFLFWIINQFLLKNVTFSNGFYVQVYCIDHLFGQSVILSAASQ